MSSYFNFLSFSRAKENKEALEKTNPKTPVLNDEDEQFLSKITSEEAPAPPLPDRAIIISDDGQTKEADAAQTKAASEILPESQPAVEGEKTTEGAEVQSAAEQGGPEAREQAAEEGKPAVAQDVNEEEPNVGAAVKDFEAPEGSETEGTKKDEELAEKHGDGGDIAAEEKASVEKQNEREKEALGESKPAKRTWASYIPPISLPSIRSKSPRPGTDAATKDTKPSEKSTKEEKPSEEPAKDDKPSEETAAEKTTEESAAEMTTEESAAETTTEDPKADEPAKTEGEAVTEVPEETTKDGSSTEEPKEKVEEQKEKIEDKGKATETSPRTWASYIPAIPAIPALPSMPNITGSKSKSQDPILNEDGTVNEEATRERDEREVSVLLDNLNLSSINNRVFSFSKESQKLYEEFTVVLKDIVNGGPTAYNDLEDLIKNNEKHLDQMFGNMPPFVKTLVKSLPAKFASTLGPEIMAAASDKPGNDMQARMAAASAPSSSAGTSSVNKKQKRKVPSAKSLVTEKGAVASMLRNILNFLKVRFPAVMTGTNVLMSLAVFSKCLNPFYISVYHR